MTELEKNRRPEALLLDLDGTLIDTQSVCLREIAESVRTASCVESSEEALSACTGRPLPEFLAELEKQLHTELPVKIIASIARVRILAAYQAQHIPVLPHALEFLSFLQEERIPYALVTSGTRPDTDLKLRSSKLLECFPVVLTSSDVDRAKPEPDMFLAALQQLNRSLNNGSALRPEQCCVIGDSVPDIAGGKAAGMVTAMVESAIPVMLPNDVRPDFTFANLEKAKEALFR